MLRRWPVSIVTNRHGDQPSRVAIGQHRPRFDRQNQPLADFPPSPVTRFLTVEFGAAAARPIRANQERMEG
jgi:hypothetical protein